MSESVQKKELLSETKIPVAPDGGWGWVVCLASFLNYVILDGALFTYGVFYVELLDYFQEGKGPTALVGSICMGMSMMLGPLASIMINFWGLRTVTICGGLLAALGFACSVAAPNLQVLTFTYGFLGGTGIAMVFVSSVVVVGFYFDKRRALANGITSSGSGLGTFIFSPLTNYFIDIYTWKGAMLLLSGITLHVALLGALYRPLKYKVLTHSEVLLHPDKDVISKSADLTESQNTPDVTSQSDEHLYAFTDENKARSLSDITAFQKNNLLKSVQLKGHMVTNENHIPSSNHFSQADSDKPTQTSTLVKPEIVTHLSHSFGNISSIKHRQHGGMVHRREFTLRPLQKENVFYSGSLHKLPHHGRDVVDDNPLAKDVPMVAAPCCKFQSKFCDSVMKITGIYLLKKPVFLFIIAYSVLWTTHSTILTILPHYCIEEGYNNVKAATLLSLIGITNTIGRILAGWMTNYERVNTIWVNTTALFMGGLVCLTVPFTHSYVLMCVEATLFGLGMATWTSLRPIILVELLGISHLTSAFGMLAMFQGLAFCVGPPIAGLLYDVTGSYKIPFVLAGTAFITSGCLCIVMNKLFTSVKEKQLRVLKSAAETKLTK